MSKRAAEREQLKQPDVPEQELASPEVELIPPHYALKDFSQVRGNFIFSQRKGDIITDQQRLYLYKQQNAPIAPFDARQMAKCPNPKCGCVFAWDGNP